ncbi:MAG TPA: hypothetical protein VGQ92_15470, partial [Actinoplanes sp.]|nr:hypothetical protein [Actinoplanes sp.]
MSRERGRPPAVEPATVEYDITVVDGAAGQRLAAVQAQAILDVLTGCREHPREPSNSDGLLLAAQAADIHGVRVPGGRVTVAVWGRRV